MKLPVLILAASLLPAALFGQAPATVKQAPPPGIAVPEADRKELTDALARLESEGASLGQQLRANAERYALLPDVGIFAKSVGVALANKEFFDPKQIAAAKAQLALGMKRAQELRDGKPGWTTATGPQVFAYQSKLDASLQPYGLVIPADWKAGDRTPRPLWLWFHGRNDKLTELAFIEERLKGKGEFAPAGTFVLHLYGRYCNASKFAGEVDAFEALAEVRRRYAIDPQRIVVAGFSMGGASAWHMATHHAGLWAAASPGAGFAETEVYAKVFDAKKEPPPWWEQVLYRWYNATDVAANLFNVPLVAYSGETDPQIQSANIMEAAMAKEGLKLERLVGSKTGHKYEPETKQELQRRLEAYVQKGREPMPPRVRFVTYTLRYHQMEWITLDALEKHWERAEIDAELVDEGTFQVKTKNIAAFTIALPVAPAPLDKTHPPRVVIDGQELVGPPVKDYWTAGFRKAAGKWAAATTTAAAGLQKKHGLTGPIDDAFMDSFVFVRPTGKPLNDKPGVWARSEMERAIAEWRRVFRGSVRVIDDTALTNAEVTRSNLVLWGDPGSNTVLAKILPKLPIQWTKDQLTLGKLSVLAADHAPILIYPNPFNPQRYVVLNSGFTFRQGSTTSNSLQTPKLPDWAAIDLRTPPGEKWPGQVVDAGFFDEQWRFP